jgi:hypothetical protein
MSDFEFEISDNDENEYDNDTTSCDFEYESENECETNTKQTLEKYVIDMDDEPHIKVSSKVSSKVSNTDTVKSKLKLKPQNHSFNSILNMEPNTIQTIKSPIKKIVSPESKVTQNTKIVKDSSKTTTSNIPKPKETIPEKTLTKKEQNFEFNPETIDFYTKDLDFKKILIKNSPFTSDIEVICLLLKYKIITDYCCSVKKCKVNTLWLDKPIQLILHRKNNIQNDLTSYNLELICGNCYLSLYGLDLFKKKEKEIIFKCEVCQFPLVNFNNYRKKKGICLACEKRITKVFTEKMNSDYYTNIQELYHDNPLLSEENKSNNYYTNKYKSSNSSNSNYTPSSASTKAPVSSKTDSKTTKPAIISLNMSIPNMDDLLN